MGLICPTSPTGAVDDVAAVVRVGARRTPPTSATLAMAFRTASMADLGAITTDASFVVTRAAPL